MAQETPIKIVIVGAGLGGLTAAFRLQKSGHDVQILERKDSVLPRGGGIMVRPNASRHFISWGLSPELESITSESDATVFRDGFSGEVVARRPPARYTKFPDWATSRDHLMILLEEQLKKTATKMRFGVTASDLSETADGATAILDSGEKIDADLVLIADGVTSRLRSKVLGQNVEATHIPGDTSYQIRIPESELFENEKTKSLADGGVQLQVWMMKHGYVVGLYKPKLQHFDLNFATKGDPFNAPSLWDANADIEWVREHFSSCEERLTAALDLAKTCDRWRKTELPQLTQWISKQGRLVLLGDSSHGMLPSAAQGFTSIVEDIAGLDFALSHTGKQDIPKAMDMWQSIRIPRVEKLKTWARKNNSAYSSFDKNVIKHAKAGNKTESTDKPPSSGPNMMDIQGDPDAEINSPAFVKWALDYDVVEEMKKQFPIENGARAQASL